MPSEGYYEEKLRGVKRTLATPEKIVMAKSIDVRRLFIAAWI
jgi:hypothetical protein